MPDFEKLGLGATTNNVTNNFQMGAMDDPRTQDRIARLIDDSLTRRQSERGRL
jgi:hypothetical protein